MENIERNLYEGKVCTKCNEWKDYSQFYKNKLTKDQLNYWCKRCNISNRTASEKKSLKKQYSNLPSDIIKYLFLSHRKVKNNSHKKRLSNQEIEQILKEQNFICPYTNKSLLHNFSNPLLSPSIDRIDSNKPYSVENCVITFRFINLGKNKYDIRILHEAMKYLNMFA